MTKTQAKEVRRLVESRVPGDGHRTLCFLALWIACLVGSCATKQSETKPSDTTPAEPGSGIVEYRQLTKESLAALHVVLDSLNKVQAQPNPCPPKVIETFADHVNRLQVDSLRIRAR